MSASMLKELGTKRRFVDESVEDVKKRANTGTEMRTGMSIEDLPNDILYILFKDYMGNFTVNLCSLVCQRWREVILGGWKSLKLFGWDYRLAKCGFREGQGALIRKLLDSFGSSGVEAMQRKIYSDGVSLNKFDMCAAKHGSIDFLRARTRNKERVDRLAIITAKGGNIHCLKYFVEERGCRMSNWLLENAVHSGNIEMLHYLKDRGCPWDMYAHCAAANRGNIEILRYLCENYPGVNLDYACMSAAKGGSLICLKYLYEKQDRPYFDPPMYRCAIGGGHVDVLCYLLESNCPFDMWGYTGLYTTAVWSEQLTCLRYLHERAPRNNLTSDLYLMAFVRSNIDIVKYLYESGCPWSNWLFREARKMDVTPDPRRQACLEYALAHGCPTMTIGP